MMCAEWLSDPVLIAETIRHPKIYPYVSDDGSPAADDFKPPVNDGRFAFIGLFDGDEYMGLFMIHAHNCATVEVHTCLLPSAWGRRAIEAAKTCTRFIFDQTSFVRIITNVPKNNPLALRLALKAGMVEYGLNPRSHRSGGVLHDQILLGISKEAPCQQQQR
jgi:RimJ/RimL family protein N-acetyltransferase